jgi:hypothetical protein
MKGGEARFCGSLVLPETIHLTATSFPTDTLSIDLASRSVKRCFCEELWSSIEISPKEKRPEFQVVWNAVISEARRCEMIGSSMSSR